MYTVAMKTTNVLPSRKISLAAGLLYLLTFVSIPTLTLYQQVKGSGYLLGSSSNNNAVIGAMLEVVVALAGIGTAVVLYPVLRKHGHRLAIGLLASRILEAAAIFIGSAVIMTIVSLHQSGAGADSLPVAHSFTVLYDRIFLQSQSFLPAINDLLLGILLYRSRLVPRPLALIGIVGAFPLLIAYLAVMFNATDQHGSAAGMGALLVALFELLLGLWLTFKGFGSSEVKGLESK